MKKRTFVAALICMLMLAALVPAPASAVDSSVRHSVVVVSVWEEYDSGYVKFYGWGSGFFVGVPGDDPAYLITNYHVIEDFIDRNEGDLNFWHADGSKATQSNHDLTSRAKVRIYYDSDDYEEAYLVDYNEKHDVALLKLNATTNKRSALPLATPADWMTGKPVYAIGYPALSENPWAAATSSFGEGDSTITGGTFSRLFTQQGTGQVNIQIDCDIKSGNSGGPLVNEEGVVLGISTWGVTSQTEATNYAISTDEIIPMLKQHSVDYTYVTYRDPNLPADETEEPPTEVEEPAESNNLLWIILGVVAVIAIGLIVYFGFIRKPKAAPAPQPAPQPTAVNAVQPPVPTVQPRTAAPAVPTVSAQPAQRRTHIVRKGDDLTVISQLYHVDVMPILQANNMTIGDTLVPGTTLIIP